jgi:hypothetical protein
VVELVLKYYVLLRALLRTRPDLRRCRTRCRHCRIYFLADPRNAGRCDLGCPFGCAEAHRKRRSNQRSTAYYQDEAGQEKKRQQNAKRRKGPAAPAPASAPKAPAPEPALPWPRSILEYVRLVVSLIERRKVSLAEVVGMLLELVRQHSMARERRIDQIIARLNERPP